MPRDLDEGTIETAMPAHEGALVLARLQVAAVAGMLDLGVDDVADLRLATEEICLLVLSEPRGPQSRLHLTLRWDDAAIEVSATVDPDDERLGATEAAIPHSDLPLQILSALTDEFGIEEESGACRAWFRKKRPST